jgi:hypothetical protein
MRFFTGFFLALSFIPPTLAQKNYAAVPVPDHFEIGRHTFFDFGPPSDFYELLLVRSSGSGSTAQRIVFTPPGDACLVPAKMEVTSASINEPLSAILGNANPCAIPEKELRRELKRCKHCMVFSGVNVTMRLNCGANIRVIRSDILDRDIFDPAPKTPKHTSWTMQLLSRLDQALGPGVMEKPAFPVLGEDQSKQTKLDSEVLERLESGTYDALFPKADTKLFDLYRAAQVHLPPPSTQLLGSSPFAPQDPVLPEYPPLAKAARIQGIVY